MDFGAIATYLLYRFRNDEFCYLVWTADIRPPSKKEALRDSGNRMIMVLDTKKFSLGVKSSVYGFLFSSLFLFSYLDTLLQNASDIITKCVGFFLTKSDSFITKYDVYYKMCRYTMLCILPTKTLTLWSIDSDMMFLIISEKFYENYMVFSPDKCYYLTLGFNEPNQK